MDKFDTEYENLFFKLNEREYIESTFQDNLKLLLKILQDNDLLSNSISIENHFNNILNQNNNIKEIVLDVEERGIPAIKLLVSQQRDDSESFSVTVINLENPEEQKQFKNSMLETIFDDTLSYIQTIALKGLKPEDAVQELPREENPANQQPGGGESALS